MKTKELHPGKKFCFLAVGDNTQLLPRSTFLFINSLLGNLSPRTAAKLAWSLYISTPNSCSETREAQENLQIRSYSSCSICSVWHKTSHLLNYLENARTDLKAQRCKWTTKTKWVKTWVRYMKKKKKTNQNNTPKNKTTTKVIPNSPSAQNTHIKKTPQVQEN